MNKLKNTFKLFTYITSSFIALLISNLAFAQESSSDAEQIEEVVVTGSRIPQKSNLVSPSPVTEVSADDFLYRGVVRTEDLLNDLPQTFASNNSSDSNGAVGIATVDLRGMGSARTLVLVDGKRLNMGSPKGGGTGVDLNAIPDLLVKKVEVLTGGASSSYGSDAIAGVVNFILDREFTGVRFDVQYSNYQHSNSNSEYGGLAQARGFTLPASSVSDGEITTLSLALGGKFAEGRGHAVIFGKYREVKEILQENRDYSVCALNASNSSCGGSSTLPQGRFTDFGSVNSSVNAISRGEYNRVNGTGNTMDTPAYTLKVNEIKALYTADGATTTASQAIQNQLDQDLESLYLTATGLSSVPSSFDYIANATGFQKRDGELFNYAPFNYYQRPDINVVLGGYGHYEFNDNHRMTFEFNYGNNDTKSQIAPSGNFFVSEDIYCGNALLTEEQYQTICGDFGLEKDQYFTEIYDGLVPGSTNTTLVDEYLSGVAPAFYIGRRNVEGGNRQNTLSHINHRVSLGFEGDLDENWSYNAFINVGKTFLSEIYLNDLSGTNLLRAIDARKDSDGNIVCASALDGTDPNCSPWNLFINNGNVIVDDATKGVTQAALDYIVLPLYASGYTTLNQGVGYILGDLTEYGIKSPLAESGIQILLGLESIKQTLSYSPDSGFSTGDGAGQGGPTIGVSGSLSSDEIFGEIKVPLIANRQFAQNLDLDIGFRSSDYSTGKNASTLKIALGWKIVDSLTVRMSSQQAVRHANIRELFRSQSLGLFDGDDPCSGSEPTATEAQCANTGVTSAQYGNVAASPAGQYNQLLGGNTNLDPEESDTFAFGFIFQPLSNFSITVDYFDIKLDKAIGGVGAQTAINECIKTGDSFFCDLIKRGAGGTLWIGQDQVINTNLNTGFEQRTGFDVNANYQLDLADNGRFDISLVMTNLTKYDSQAVPGGAIDECIGKWGSLCGAPNPANTTNLRGTWHTNFNLVLSLGLRSISGVEADESSSSRPDLDGASYVDLVGIYSFNDSISVRLGFNNLLDAEPPIAGNPPGGNGNTYPGVYDAFGRYVFFGLTAEF